MQKILEGKSHKRIQFSYKYNCFVWTPAKTASTHCWSILTKFDFRNYSMDELTGEIIKPYDIHAGHTHQQNLLHNHHKYELIQSIRNPYAMLVSLYKAANDEFNYEKFYDRLYNIVYNSDMVDLFNYPLRKPNYFVRLENLYDDYLKIPFIRESSMNTSGELKNKCSIPLNRNFNNGRSWQEFYNKKTADLVFYNFANVFEEHGYDKNSWKN